MVLLINACVRSQSRTKRLADELMKKLGGPVREVRLWEIDLPLVDEAFIQKREELVNQGAFDSPVLALAKRILMANTHLGSVTSHSMPIIRIPGTARVTNRRQSTCCI